MITRNWLCLTLLSVGVCLVAGCGASAVKAKGKVVKGGQPFPLGERGMYLMSFTPDNEANGKMTYAVETKADGTFEVVGPERKGAPPGKYKVAVQAMDPYDKSVDKLKGQFAPGKSTLTAEIKNASEEIVIDVGK